MNNGDNNFYTNDNFYTNEQNHSFDEQYSARKAEGERLSTVCMVLGIISAALVFTCPCIPTFILSIISLYYFSKAKKVLGEPKLNGKLIAGMICSIISLAISIFYTIFFIFYFSVLAFLGIIGAALA